MSEHPEQQSETPEQAPAPTAATAQPESLSPAAEPSVPSEPAEASAADAAPEPAEQAAAADATPEPAEQAPAADATPEPTEEAPEADATPEPTEASAPATPADAPAVPTPASVPKPGPAPKPSALPRPSIPAPVTPPATPTAPAPSTEAPLDPAVVTAAAQFGRVDAEGTVYVTDGGSERVVGQFPDAPAEEAMLLYIRRFVDLQAQVTLFETRLPQLTGRDIDTTVSSLKEALTEPAAVGDLAGLRQRMDELTERATARKQELAAEREAARAAALREREAIIDQAEAIAATDPSRMQWKAQGAQLRELLESWKSAQRSGVRLDRKDEDALWKRFAKARSTFDRARRAYFSELDAKHKEAKAAKEALIARAEELQHSTDWGGTSAAYRQLMEEWKRAGRAARKDDDALWARFRAAQDVFFEARNAQNAQIDAEYEANLEVKNEILVEAEALLPVTDVASAKAALRKLQDRWDAAGKVPRAAMKSTEARMRAVEQAVRTAEEAQWRRSNPQKRDRAEGFAAQLLASIERLEDDLAKAQRSGNESKIASATQALQAQRAFLEQAQRAADDAR